MKACGGLTLLGR